MEFFKKIRKIIVGQPVERAVDFTHLLKSQKVDLLEREAREFDKKYGQVIKKLAHE